MVNYFSSYHSVLFFFSVVIIQVVVLHETGVGRMFYVFCDRLYKNRFLNTVLCKKKMLVTA